jgi:ABC-type sugar transport system substrate-binding protein
MLIGRRLSRIFAVTLLAILACACRRDTADPQAFRFVIGVSLANLTEPWRINMSAEIKAQAAAYKDLRVVFADAADSSDRQVQDVEKLLASGIDLLIISPTDAEALTPVIASAYKGRHVPVILLDRSVIGYDYTLFIGPDNQLIGKQVGQYVAGLLGGEGGEVMEILGRAGSPPVTDRSLGFREAISHAKNIRIVGTISADWLRDKAEDELAAWLRKHPPVDVIFAQNDAMAFGAYKAARRLGITGIKFVGIDGLPGPEGGQEMVISGQFSATFTCPTGGREAVIYAMDILNHVEGIPKKMILRTTLLTREAIAKGALSPTPTPRVPIWSPEHRIVLGFAQVGKESDWRLANTESIKAAAREAGIELIFRDGEQRQENQIKAIREFIARKVDIISFSANVESGWGEVLREAKAAGIPVFIIDRPVDEKDESLWVTLMGSDFLEEGRRAAQWLVEYMNTDKQVDIVELQGTIGSAPAIDRKIGFEEVLKEYPNYSIIRSESGDFFRNTGEEVMRKILRELAENGKTFNVLFAHNDDMAIGAIKAMEEVGLRPGKDVVVVSVDAIGDAFRAMIGGKLNCSVECTPLLGPLLMKTVKDYFAGKTLPVRIVTSEEVFPAEVARRALPGRKY